MSTESTAGVLQTGPTLSTGEILAYGVRNSSRSERMSHFYELVSLARYIGSTSRKMLANTRHLPVVGGMKLVALGTLPIRIYDVVAPFFAKAKLSLNEKVDRVLDLVSSVGNLGDTVSTVAEGFSAVGAVAEHAVRWATPLLVVSMAFQAVGLVLIMKKMRETRLFTREMHDASGWKEEEKKYAVDDLTQTIALIQDRAMKEKSFVAKHFKVDGDIVGKLQAKLATIRASLESANEEEQQAGNAELQKTMALLKNRVKATQWSNTLNLLIGVVGMVATGILFTPLAPIGFGVLALITVISLRTFFVDKAKTRQFEQALEGAVA